MLRNGTISGRLLSGQNTVYVALGALLALVGGLTWHARSSERSHEKTVANVLRDYAAFAAWQYEREVQGRLGNHIQMSLSDVRRIRFRRTSELPPPSILTDGAHHCSCGLRDAVVFAFRMDVTTGAVTADRASVPAGALTALAVLGPTFHAGDESDSVARAQTTPFASLRFDTLGGRSYALAYALLRDERRLARAVYGVALDPARLGADLRHVFAERPLLPPALVGSMPNDSVVRLRVAHPVAGDLFVAAESPMAGDIAVSDTADQRLGGIVTTVALRPSVRQSLLIPGPPRTALPVYVAMFAVALALAFVAALQLRRSRALTRLREQFIANVSHELRTPLAQISMFSETLLLDRERSPQEGRHFVSVIYREARRLSALVENVLRFSRGESNSPAAEPSGELRNLSSDVRETVDEFAPLAHRSRVTFRNEVADNLWARVDAGALRQILLNLLDNAVKFGPHAQTITLRGVRSNGIVKLSVEDQGRGIPRSDRVRVFEPFTRLTDAAHSAAPGTGIGLSVVRDLVTAHGGSVWIADSETPNVTSDCPGVCVGFSLPAGDAA